MSTTLASEPAVPAPQTRAWVRPALLVGCAWILLSLLTAGQVYVGRRAVASPSHPFLGLFAVHLVDWLPWALLAPVIHRLGRRHPLHRSRWPAALAVHVAASLAIAALKLLFDNAVAHLSEGVALVPARFFRNYMAILTGFFHTQVLVYWLILSGGLALDLYRRLRSLPADGPGTAAPDHACDERLAIRSAGKVVFVRTEEIDWIGAADYYAEIHAGGASHLLRETLTELEARLDPRRFLRIHRSAIVNLDRVQGLERSGGSDYRVVLRDGTSLRLSRSRRKGFEDALSRSR